VKISEVLEKKSGFESLNRRRNLNRQRSANRQRNASREPFPHNHAKQKNGEYAEPAMNAAKSTPEYNDDFAPVKRPDAIALVGATASGKTASALEFAFSLGLHNDFAFPVEIISADSRQVYRHLSVGTAKPTPEELGAAPHHFIDERNPDERFSAGDFGEEASRRLAEIRSRGKLPLIVGGSGLYVQALADGFFDENAAFKTSGKGRRDDGAAQEIECEQERRRVRKELEQAWKTQGIEALRRELWAVDATSAHKYADGNPRRILRALEFYRLAGTPFSEAHGNFHVERDFTVRFFGIHVERDELYNRINKRAEEMFRRGIVEETEAALKMGYSPLANALNTVGYKESLALLRGEITLRRAVELTQQNTRRYAKRQLTWFRRDARIEWLSGSPEEIAHAMITRLGR
jgi:tRNA dimethylallyltransferase